MWPNSGEILPAAFADSGARVVSFRPHSVEPSGGGYLFGYEVDTIDSAGVESTVLTFIDTDPASVRAAESGSGSGIVTDPATGLAVRVWAYPADPALPALTSVTYPERVVEILHDAGITVANPTLSVAAYRPGKRAVIRADCGDASYFLKVVRPTRAEPIAAQHRAFIEQGLPVPHVVAVRPDGLLVLERVRGVPAGTRVVDIAREPGFIDSLVALGRAIAGVHLTQEAQADALDNADWHRRSLAASLPEDEARIHRIYDEIDLRRSSWSPDERQVVHGDLHFEQLFVDADEPAIVSGLLDIDTAGWGHPARDAGALVAHLVVTAQWHRGNGDTDEARACESIADAVATAWTSASGALADRLPPTIASQLLAHAGGQANLGTDVGRAKARQLLDATEGTLWPGRPEQGTGGTPSVAVGGPPA